jgi:precorrin-4/cobalt-precorrin-4 C11-methyltransferase
MKAYFVGAGPGDPELLTLKGKRLLEEAPICIYAGSLVNPTILKYLPAGAEIFDSASMDLEQITAIFKRARDEGKNVVRLHTGDPALYSAINEQMEKLEELGIDYEVVPGISAFQASAAALRTELTAPEISQTIILTRLEGRTPVPERERLENLAATGATLCLYLSVAQLDRIVDIVLPHYGPDCPAAVLYKVSWPEEKIITSTLADISHKVRAEGIKKTALIVIGKSLGSRGTLSKLYAGHFSHGYREATAASGHTPSPLKNGAHNSSPHRGEAG